MKPTEVKDQFKKFLKLYCPTFNELIWQEFEKLIDPVLSQSKCSICSLPIGYGTGIEIKGNLMPLCRNCTVLKIFDNLQDKPTLEEHSQK